ncbi:hypothetical protein LguiB_010014 [Lonicera macranthoides]
MDISRHFKSYTSSHNKFYTIDTNNYTHKRKNKKKIKERTHCSEKSQKLEKDVIFLS